jgi:hypothetical protein
LAAALAVVCLSLAFPRAIAAFTALDARALLWDMHRNEGRNDPQRMAHAAAALERSLWWVPDGEMAAERAYLLMRQAQAQADPASRTQVLRQAEDATIAAVALAPAQPVPWLRLAWLQSQRGDAQAAARSLRLSMLTGPLMPPIMTSRLELGLRLLPALDAETRSLLARQIRLAWVTNPTVIADLSARPGLGPTIRAALDGLSESEVQSYLRTQAK